MSSAKEATQELRQLIHQMNETWAKGHPEKLADFFHEDIVMVHPDFTNRYEGRNACVASYAEFCNAAVIHDVKLGEVGIDLFENTAVATYSYEVDYEMGGERFNDKGRDIFLFIQFGGRWQAVWRTMIISQPESVN